MAELTSQPTILCVDDEAPGLYFRKLILEKQGYRVLTAGSAREGVELFKANHVDLVVTDHLLGRSTGTTMAAEIRRLNPEVPILVLSGTSDIPEALENADIFLSKAEGPQLLLENVRQLLDRTRLRESQPTGGQYAGEIFRPETGALQALLAAIVEGSEDAIFSKTLDGIIISWNKAAERMYGYRAEEVIGKPVSLLLPADRPNEVRDILQRLRKGEKLRHYETVRVAKDGGQLNVALTISPICDSAGNIVGASTIARDVTQLKMAEQALRNSEKLAVAGRMAATVAHEINNPVEAVHNILYLLDQSAQLDDSAREFVRAAQEELKRIGQISSLTLGFYRGGENRQSQVRISDLIENVLTLYSRKIDTLQVSLQKRYEGSGTVLGDFGELRQVFSNLIVNAIDALSKTGNRLCVHIYDSVDWKAPHRKGVRTVIGDDGPGIAAADRARLFELFYTTKGEKGTGVGLWVSRDIVHKHNGSIRLRTSTVPGRSGTYFSVFLPFS